MHRLLDQIENRLDSAVAKSEREWAQTVKKKLQQLQTAQRAHAVAKRSEYEKETALKASRKDVELTAAAVKAAAGMHKTSKRDAMVAMKQLHFTQYAERHLIYKIRMYDSISSFH